MVSFTVFAPVLIAFLSTTYITRCAVAQEIFEPVPFERPYLRRECNFLNGFDLTPTSFTITNTGSTATYTPTNSLPIFTNGGSKRISFFSLQAQCGNNVPPTCSVTVDLRFCNSSPAGTCTFADPSFRRGLFFASGTGPAAYNVSGGNQSFIGATGSFDSDFDEITGELKDIRIFICYRRLPGPVFAPPPTPAPVRSPVQGPSNPSGGTWPPRL